MNNVRGAAQLLDYGSILVRRRWVVYLAAITVTSVALIGSFLMTPLYRSTVTLQIDRQSPDILTFRDLSKVDYSWVAYSDFFQTQYRIMSSLPVARIAVERLGLDAHPMFESQDSEPGWIARLRSLIPRRGTEVAVDPLDLAAAQLLAGLSVAPIPNSNLVHLSLVGPDPNLAAEAANALAGAYIGYNVQSRYSTSEQADDFLINQIAKLKTEIAETEEKLLTYGEAKRIVSIDEANNITLQGLKDIATRRTAARTSLAQAEARLAAIRQSPANSLPEVLNSTLIGRLLAEYAAYEAEYSEKSMRFKDAWPGMQTLNSKLDQARLRLELETERIASQVLAAAESEYIRASSEVANLDRLLRSTEAVAQSLKRDSVDYTTFHSEMEKKRETLDRLIKRQNELALSTELTALGENTQTNIRILEEARPATAAFRPNLKVNLLLGIVLGVMLGVSAAVILEYLDNTVKSSAELERITDKPILATIPRHGKGAVALSRVRRREPAAPGVNVDLVTHEQGRADVSEAYRELRTALLLSHAGEPPRLIMVTSPLPEEGKSATAINLAIVLSQLGRRVLIVDTDLRRPRLHRALATGNDRGVSTFLSGLENDVSSLISRTAVEGLDLVSSGPIPPNPSELLNSPRFAQLGEELLALRCDHVIFDSPPVMSVSDPVIIANAVDSAILVVRAGRTPRQAVRSAVEKLGQANNAPNGIVLNDVDVESHGSYHYRYTYHEVDDETATSDPPTGRRAGGARG